MKVFWIGESTELFIGNNVEEIFYHCGCDDMRMNIDSANFGEITNMNMEFIVDSSKTTLGEILKDAKGCGQISSAYW